MITCSALSDQLVPIYQQQLDFGSDAATGQTDCGREELETMLGVGVLIFQNIRQRHLVWHAQVETNQIPYDVEDAQVFADQYQQWKIATEHWLAQVEKLQHKGYEPDHAAEVRTFHNELKLVDLDVRGLMRRWEDLENGKGMDAGEFFASLPKRASA